MNQTNGAIEENVERMSYITMILIILDDRLVISI